MYSPTVWQHARQPQNAGTLKDPDAQGQATYKRCGDVMEMTFTFKEGRIHQVYQKTRGCGAAKAAASLATTLLQGKSLEEARNLDAFALDKALGGLPAAKRHALLMVLQCLHEALGPRESSSASSS